MSLKNPMKKTNWLTYTAATAAILAGCAMTAPYTVASAQDDVLAGAPAQNSQTMRQITVFEKDGKILVDEGYEIHIENGEAKGWKIDSKSGKRKRVDIQALKDLDGFDFDISKDGSVSIFADNVVRIPRPPAFTTNPVAPLPPMPPLADIVTIDRSDGGIVSIVTRDGQNHVIKSHSELKDQIKREVTRSQVFIHNGQMEIAETEAKLAAAQSLLSSMAKSDLPEARREIKKAQRALKEAEKALSKARAKQK